MRCSRGSTTRVVSVHQHFTLDRARQTERIVRAVQNPYAGILAHMTGRLLLRRPGYEVDIGAVLRACADTGTVLEINANPYRLDLDWRDVIRARELGCRFAVNPDAHHPDGYHDVRYGVLMARKAGLRASDIVNTAATAKAFLASLKTKPGS
jgi:DNA polymerase (family 10)